MAQQWDDKAARNYVSMADIIVPDRRRQYELVADLVPFGAADEFHFIDMGCGEGLLTALLLDRFPKAVAHASDVAAEMLSKAATVCASYGQRAHLSCHNIHEPDYLDNIVAGPVGLITSSLAVHHCDDSEKRTLYRMTFEKLRCPGAFLVIDVVKPVSSWGVRFNKKHWQQIIQRQSIELTGSHEQFRKYEQIPIMFYDTPAAEDKPATLAENLQFISEAGFQGVDCFWRTSGFALFGGYRGI
jgi:tRNA (cmo5U34)-methyltransferase